MHRTGVDGACGQRGFRLGLVEIFGRIGREFGAAAGRAEMEGLAMMLEAVLRGHRVDAHAADWIKRLGGGSVGMMVRMAGVIRMPATAH
jgi:hypothetical protein